MRQYGSAIDPWNDEASLLHGHGCYRYGARLGETGRASFKEPVWRGEGGGIRGENGSGLLQVSCAPGTDGPR